LQLGKPQYQRTIRIRCYVYKEVWDQKISKETGRSEYKEKEMNLNDLSKNLPVSKASWNEYFFGIALMVSARSDCTRRQFGCIAVSPDKRIVATGYNAPPKGILSKVEQYKKENKGEYPCGFGCCKGLDAPKNQSYSKCVSVHAEQNCILQLGVNNHYEYVDLYLAGRDGQTGELLDTGKPCIHCSRFIRQANVRLVKTLQIDKVVHLEPKNLEIVA
jgi:dCMP deaminase